ncbi:MAG: TonB-dependent receptor, partial [Cyanobacteria bacterium P01_C01_bin.70]
LRGPQSTLYGRNSQAGVVNITSRPPSAEPEARVSALVGSFGERQAQFSFSNNLIPDTLGVRLAGISRVSDGFTENTLLDDNADEQSGRAGRLNLVWTPADRWNVSLNATLASTEDDASVYVPIDQEDPFETARSDNGNFDLDTNTQALRVGYEGDSLQFTSITSRNETDYDYTSVNDDFALVSIDDLEQEIFSQEFRLQSPATADQFQWIVGAFFQSRDFRLGFEDDYMFAFPDFGIPFPGTDASASAYQQTTYAGFAQIDYKPIEPLTLTAGLRYEFWQEELDRDASTFRASEGGAVMPSPLAPLSEIDDSDIDGDVWLPRFAINYQVSPNVGVYGSIARGYRPGTHNFLAFTDEELIIEPENSWSYELGLKSSWFGDRLGINLAAFYNDISDLQVLVLDDSFLFADISTADARAIGAELEIRATPFDGFDIVAGLGYTDAEFTDNTNPFTGEDFDGNNLLYAPDYTYNVALQYRSPKGFFGRLEVQGVGTVFFDEANDIEEDPFTLVNARVGYEFEAVGLYLFANNLFDTEYVTLAFPGFGGDVLAGYGDRRTFGIQVRSQF